MAHLVAIEEEINSHTCIRLVHFKKKFFLAENAVNLVLVKALKRVKIAHF